MSLLTDLIASTDPIVAEAAKLTQDATAAYQTKQITLGEYQEIVGDILDLGKVGRLTSDMKRQNAIAEIYNQIKSFCSSLPSISI
jgi:hypothetical protein